MKMVASYLNFAFFIEVKAKSKYRILNFVFQFIKKAKWHFGSRITHTYMCKKVLLKKENLLHYQNSRFSQT